MHSSTSPRPWKALALTVLAAYLSLAYVYVFVQQPRYGPDEPRHFGYVRRLVEKGRLPIQLNGVEEDEAHTLHPPLYYLLVSPLFAAARGAGETAAYYAIKCASPLLLLGALLLFGSTLRRIFPDCPFARCAALAMVALLPLFLLEACIVNNDVLAVLLGSLLLWLVARTWEDPPSARTALFAGLVMAAFVNTKATGWTLAPLWGLALLLRSVKRPEDRRGFLRDLGIGYGVLLLLGTWWYARNYHLYGSLVPLDFGPGGLLHPVDDDRRPMSPAEVYVRGYVIRYGERALVGIFQSFWSQIDWINERYRPVVFGAFLGLVLLALAGGMLRLLAFHRQPAGEVPAEAKAARLHRWLLWLAGPLTVVGAAFLLNWAHTWYIATFVHQGFYQGGRYLMPSVFGAGALLAAGWRGIVPPRGQLAFAVLIAVGLVTLNALCLVELVTYLNPTYVR